MNCPDFDLCSTCEAQNMHPKTHVFVKIRIPIPTLAQPHQILDPWYSGDPDRRWPALKPSLRKRFVTDSGFDDLQVEALYDQFTCTANVGFPDVSQSAIRYRVQKYPGHDRDPKTAEGLTVPRNNHGKLRDLQLLLVMSGFFSFPCNLPVDIGILLHLVVHCSLTAVLTIPGLDKYQRCNRSTCF